MITYLLLFYIFKRLISIILIYMIPNSFSTYIPYNCIPYRIECSRHDNGCSDS